MRTSFKLTADWIFHTTIERKSLQENELQEITKKLKSYTGKIYVNSRIQE
jgi:hypothetical protein